MELLMAVAFWARVPDSIRLLFLSFNLFFHSYIFFAYGVPNHRWSFIPWNMWCFLTSQIVFSPVIAETEPPWTATEMVVLLVLNAFPFLSFFGLCPNPCLAHYYFAPGWFGDTILLLKRKEISKIPPRVNGRPVPVLSRTHRAEEFALAAKVASNHLKSTPHLLFDTIMEEYVGLDAEMVNLEYDLGSDDLFRDDHRPITFAYWKAIAEELNLKDTIYVEKCNYSVFGGPKFLAKLLH